ncbi:MAG: ORF6N domain-containing protein [Bryobacteraceae bacterium]
MPRKQSLVLASRSAMEFIAHRIYFLRGRKVMLDSDLAGLYQVETKALNRAVKRNPERFPGDFTIRLTGEELLALRCQSGTSKVGRGGPRYLPYAFTQEGVAMLSSVLHSARAARVNVAIMRTFVKLREVMEAHVVLSRKIGALARKYRQHDEEIQMIFETLKRLMERPAKPKQRIGFAVDTQR